MNVFYYVFMLYFMADVMPCAFVEDVKPLVKAICFVADVGTTVADGITTIGRG